MGRISAWFIHNPIAANLLMLLIFIGGFTTIPSIDKQFFPERKLTQISISVTYPGAGPAEVETQICIRIEEAINDLDGIDEINAFAREGRADIIVDISEGFDSQRLLNNIKSRVDSINTFPVEAERPRVSENNWESRMVSLALYGYVDEKSLKELGESLRDKMAVLPHVALVKLRSPRKYELAIEVSEADLKQFGLRFEDVVLAINDASIILPGGKIRAEGGDIQIQTRDQAYTAEDFEQIVLLSSLDGVQVKLGDIATVIDGFEETNMRSRFNDQPSLAIDVYVTSDPDVLKTSRVVNDFVEKVRPNLPAAVTLEVWRDSSVSFKGRIATLVYNGIGGLILVFVVLVLFLRPILAFWVCCGIAVAFLGGLWFLPLTGASLNMVSLFAFILILGIIVDDAIIVAESIYSESQRSGRNSFDSAVVGTQLVLKPVLFAVISTILFFAPMAFLDTTDRSAYMLACVVSMALFFSLVESLFILPAHLADLKPEKLATNPLLIRFNQFRNLCSSSMESFAQNIYRPFLLRCIVWRGVTFLAFVFSFLIAVSLLVGNWLDTSFFPKVPVDYISTRVTMPLSGPFSDTEDALDRVEGGAKRMKEELNTIASLPFVGNIESAAYGNSVSVTIELINVDERDITGFEIKEMWEDYIGELSMAEEYEVIFTAIPLGKPIELLLAAADVETLRSAAGELKQELARYPGVYNIRDSLDKPGQEIALSLKPEAESLNISLAEIARQIRRGFYGEEVQRIPRLREDVKVMVRYPADERSSTGSLENVRIRTNEGIEIPFDTVADYQFVDGYSEIKRKNRKRITLVSADLQRGNMPVSAIVSSILASKKTDWEQRYPGLTVGVEGEESERSDFITSLIRMMALSSIAIYGLIAIAFRSYWQPLLVLSAIPFGYMGAIFGHVVMGIDVSMFSMMGMLATAGVVVNDNLVLIDRVNYLRDQGQDLLDALLEGAQSRFRPIILTSITTFVGLLPIMMERSVQAQFLTPMVVSLAFGVLLATFVTLIFVPVLYLNAEAFIAWVKRQFAQALLMLSR